MSYPGLIDSDKEWDPFDRAPRAEPGTVTCKGCKHLKTYNWMIPLIYRGSSAIDECMLYPYSRGGERSVYDGTLKKPEFEYRLCNSSDINRDLDCPYKEEK